MKRIYWILTSISLYSLLSCSNGAKDTREYQTVKTDTVVSAGGQTSLQYPGKVKAAQDISLAFRVSGTIQKIYVKDGARVQAGQLLAELDPTDYQVQLDATDPDNWNRFAAGLLAILLCLCSFSMPAFASGTDPAPEPLPEITKEEPTTGGMEPLGVPITPKGNATLVDDFYGDKQLITVTTKAGNYFYILIDRANEDKETSVHFLNQVDDADLLALLDEEPQETEVCTCTVKCDVGDVNENCPLCEKSLRNCTAPEAVKTDTETPEEKPKSSIGSLMILLVLALAGGGAALYYFKFRKPKADTTGHDDLDEYDFGEDEDADEEPAEIEIHSEDGQESEI